MTTINLEKITLHKGNHTKPKRLGASAKACAMEWVSVLAGETWSDHPQCTDVYIASFVRNWNDGISDDARRTELLRPLLPLLVGTRGSDALMLRRMWLGIDWDIRTRTPAFLRLAGLTKEAAAVAALREIRSQEDLANARATLQEARTRSTAAWDAAGAAARDAAWDAAGDAAWDAAGDAAWDAAGDAAWDAAGAAAWDAAWDAARDAARDAAWDAAGCAARDAAWDAARDAAWDAAGCAARDAAWDAAWDAARDAARDAAWAAAGCAARDAAWDAAWDAARSRLAPTVAEMQESAVELVTRMCALTEDGHG